MEAQKKQLVEAIKSYVIPEGCIIVKDEKLLYHTKCARCAFYYCSDSVNWRCDWCSKLICRDCLQKYVVYGTNGQSYWECLLFCNDECESKHRTREKKRKNEH